MRKSVLLITIILVLFPRVINPKEAKKEATQPEREVVLTVVYNNVGYDKRLTTAWGFSCVIKGMEKTILFDTGGEGVFLLSNMKKLRIHPENIDVVVLSHIHADHVGGLKTFLGQNSKVAVYLPESFPGYFKKSVKKLCGEIISVDGPVNICEGVWSTGEMKGYPREQSLLIDTKEGIIIVTGCAHPGIVSIARKAKELLNKEIYLITGGFHLIGYPRREIQQIIEDLKQLGVKKIGPSHCSGELAIELFSQAWGKDFVDLGCGSTIKIK